jgi:nitrite reductase (NADH) small subunit
MNSTEKRWMRVTPCENIPLREGKTTELAGRQIAIFNVGGSFLAVENRCPHRGGPLADGIVFGSKVACPLHAWTFDLADGRVVNHPESQACLETFPVRIEAGVLWVEVPLAEREADSEPVSCDHRDRPVRWVQRKPSEPESAHPSLS